MPTRNQAAVGDWEQEPQAEDQRGWLQLVDDLLGQTEATKNPSERASLLCKVAEVYERRLGDPDSALVSLQAAFKEEPSSGQVVQEMERLARANGKWRDVVVSATEVAEDIADPRQAADLWVQIAFWYDACLVSLDEASAAARRALRLDASHGGALTLLEGIYRRQRNWDQLVEILSLKWDTPYRDEAKIAEAYAEILRADPAHAGALAGLAVVCEDTGMWERASELLERMVPVCPQKERVDLHYHLGFVLQNHLRDPRAAEEHFVQAQALHPEQAHLPSMLALIEIYKQRGDWLKAAQLLLRAADQVSDSAQRLRLIFEGAEVFHKKLDDEGQAADLYALALTLDPENLAVAKPLSEIYFKRGAWTALRPVIERLARVDNSAPVLHRLGKTAQQLGDEEAAITAYGGALASDETYLPALLDWGALCFEHENWASAARLYDAALNLHPDALKREETLDLLYRLGVSKLLLGELDQAVAHLEKARAADPRSRVTLESLTEAHTLARNWEAVINDKQALLLMTSEADGRVALQDQIAEICRTELQDPQRAITAYMAALDIRPDDRQVMHKVLELLTETKQWKQAVAILRRLADGDSGQVRARCLVAAANILNYELNAVDEAVEVYNLALDDDPDDLKTFERVDKLLTSAKDWKNQERAYRKQIKRMGLDPAPEKKAALLALWQGLGEIYRSRLRDFPAAMAAFEVCVGLDPETLSRRAILAELYQLAGPPTYAKAIGEYRLLIKSAVDVGEMIPHLKLLLRLFVELVEFDHAWCVAHVLVVLGSADADEQRLYEQYRPRGFVRARSRLTEEMWQKNLYHPDQDRRVSQILATVGQGVAAARSKPHKEWGLKRKDHRDVAHDQVLFCKVLNYASQILNVPWPEVYLAPDVPGEIDMANARATNSLIPSFVVGRDLLQGRPEAEVAFVTAKNLAMMRPDHFVRWPSVVPSIAELKVVLLAAISLVTPDYAVDADLAEGVAQYRDFLRKVVPPQMIEQLAVLIQRFGGPLAEVDLTRWARAVYLTATRAGFLICNDLNVAARLGQIGSAAAGVLDPVEVVRDLVEWGISEDYFALRAHLGLGVGAA
ncbi:MAG TPA: tetratricopeptide repeat protein [Polyangia bacterium]|nr:tetratricopeptide repeat protein [Polyangia bacterium]